MRARLPALALLAALSVVAVGLVPTAAAHHRAPIQPGADIVVEGGTSCTLNFVFAAPNGTLYAGTAGHCVGEVGNPALVKTEDEQLPHGNPIFAVSPDRAEFGRVVFRIGSLGGEVLTDFGLIRIHEDWRDRVDPTVRSWGGPSGDGRPEPGTKVYFHGHGAGFSLAEPTRGRVGVVEEVQAGLFGVRLVDAQFHNGPSVQGDSGTPVVDESGRAVGIIAGDSHEVGPSGHSRWGPTFPQITAWLEQAGFELELVHGDEPAIPEDPRDARAHAERSLEHCRTRPVAPRGCVNPPWG